MPLGIRDILLIIRAKDQASRTLLDISKSLGLMSQSGRMTAASMQRTGAGILAVGAAIGAVGAAGLAFFHSALMVAVDFDSQSRATLTQVGKFKPALQEIKDLGLEVAKSIAVPFEQIQPALFDIFSSVPVDNMREARDILIEMSRAAVAGVTDVQTVARSNFEIMNTFGLKTEDLNHLLDVQFALVRVGIGTYSDLNIGIGRLAAPFHNAGQSIEQMAGSLAFATRVLGPGEAAIAGASRAIEALTNPKVVKRLRDMGVAVLDAAGNVRPFSAVLTDLAAKMEGVPTGDKIAQIFDLLKGGGNAVQARRFLEDAINNIDGLNESIFAVSDSAGALQNAYDIMAAAPASKIELLKNQFKVLRTEIGEQLMPKLDTVLRWFQNAVTWWDNLSTKTKNLITDIGLLMSALLVFTGIGLAVAGVLLLVGGGLLSMGFGIGLILGEIGIFIATATAMVAFVVIMLLLIKHLDGFWKKVAQVVLVVGSLLFIAQLVTSALTILATVFMTLGAALAGIPLIGEALFGIGEAIMTVAGLSIGWILLIIIAIVALGYVVYRNWSTIKKWSLELWHNVLQPFWQWLKTTFTHVWNDYIYPALLKFGAAMQWVWEHVLIPFWHVLRDDVIPALEAMGQWIADHWELFVAFWLEIGYAVQWLWENALMPLWHILRDDIIPAFQAVWQTAQDFYQTVLVPIGNFIGGYFSDVWNGLAVIWNTVVYPAIAGVVAIYVWLWHAILEPILSFLSATWNVAWQELSDFWNDTLKPAIDAVVGAFSWLWNNVMMPMSSWIAGGFHKIIDGLIGDLKTLVGLLGDARDLLGGSIVGSAGAMAGGVNQGGLTGHVVPPGSGGGNGGGTGPSRYGRSFYNPGAAPVGHSFYIPIEINGDVSPATVKMVQDKLVETFDEIADRMDQRQSA